VPLRARRGIRPPDRNIVRQVAVIHRPIRTQEPSWYQACPGRHRGQKRQQDEHPRRRLAAVRSLPDVGRLDPGFEHGGSKAASSGCLPVRRRSPRRFSRRIVSA
jgi:hypothetical protein